MVWLAVAAFVAALVLAALTWRAWSIDRRPMAGVLAAGAVTLLAATVVFALVTKGDDAEPTPTMTGPELIDRPGPPAGILAPVTTAPPAPSATPS